VTFACPVVPEDGIGVSSACPVGELLPGCNPCQKTEASMKHKELTGRIIECAFKVHNALGFGFLENVYRNALMIELTKAGLPADMERRIQVSYDGQVVGDYVADIVVEDKVMLELKSVKELHPTHDAQLVNYLKATGMEIGLLINFGDRVDVKRKVLDR
jgi:GxxExxY protein